MRFSLIDRIVELVPGSRIKAVKALTVGEEYLADHFPRFAVMPGVLMLEALTQAGAWLLRATADFPYAVVVLKEARNIRYAGFVRPGDLLMIDTQIVRRQGQLVHFKAAGAVDGVGAVVSGRYTLEGFNPSERHRSSEDVDVYLQVQLRQQLQALWGAPRSPPSDPSTPRQVPCLDSP